MDNYPEYDASESGSEILSDSQLESDEGEEDERELEELAELEAAAAVNDIRPYQVQPQFAEGEADERFVEEGGEADLENRLGNNDW